MKGIMTNSAEWLDRARSRAEVVGAIAAIARRYFLIHAVATWALLVGIGIGVVGLWAAYQIWLAATLTPWYFVSTFSCWAVGVFTAGVAWVGVRLLRFVSSAGFRDDPAPIVEGGEDRGVADEDQAVA